MKKVLVPSAFLVKEINFQNSIRHLFHDSVTSWPKYERSQLTKLYIYIKHFSLQHAERLKVQLILSGSTISKLQAHEQVFCNEIKYVCNFFSRQLFVSSDTTLKLSKKIDHFIATRLWFEERWTGKSRPIWINPSAVNTLIYMQCCLQSIPALLGKLGRKN